MAFDNTITEYDMDDLAVDGLSEGILSRILGLFGVGRS